MGYDTSHHPVDLGIVETVTEYIAGRGSIDALVADAVRVAKVRFRANAWGLAVSRAKPPGFDSWLHVWGRPFFVTLEGDAVGDSIDRYLACTSDADVDVVAKEMVRVLEPALADTLVPREEGKLPDDEALARGIRANIDLLRRAASAPRNGTIEMPDGEAVPASEILARETPLLVLTFMAHLRPGWMDRGYVWATELVRAANLESPVFEAPRALLGRLAERDERFFLETTIVENYMVGAMVPAASVPDLSALLTRQRDALERGASKAAEPSRELRLSVKKLLEAVRDAERRGLAFAEATEIYSGFSGILN